MLQIAIYLSRYAQEEGETIILKSTNKQIYFFLNSPGFNLYFISKWFSLYFYKNNLMRAETGIIYIYTAGP